MKFPDLIQAVNCAIEQEKVTYWPLFGDDGSLIRSNYVTASEIGGCERKIKLDKLADKEKKPYTKTKPSDDWGRWERGHNVEGWFINKITSVYNNSTLKFTGSNQRSFVADHQAGTPDGVFIHDDGIIVLDVKSFHPNSNTSNFPKVAHVDQIMQNLDLVSHNMSVSPIGGLLVYINCDNYKDMHLHTVEWDEEHANRLMARAERILTTDPKQLEPEGMIAGGCNYCNHTTTCAKLNMEGKQNEKLKRNAEAAAKLFGQRAAFNARKG